MLALLIAPIAASTDTTFFALATWASIWSMASKYIFAIGKKHLFNPAAFAIALTSIAINQSANWWVGTAWMLPFVLVGGLLLVRKIRRFDLVVSFFAVAMVSIVVSGIIRGVPLFRLVSTTLVETPIFFFAFVMLTEPLTTPPTKTLRLIYGAVVGLLFAPWVHVGSFYSTPEIALVLGNIFSYLVSPKAKFVMNLKEQITVADHTSDFLFEPSQELKYRPGQYMEWTLEHERPDRRGNRRYFTLASSPTEKDLRIGVKFYPDGSSFKHALSGMVSTDVIVGAQLAGDFVLPINVTKKLVFIAGGIGVTPFRSMIKYLVDRHEPRDIVLFYSNKTPADIAYRDVFDAAKDELGIKTIYALTDKATVPAGWTGKVGYVDAKMIAEEVPDFADREFFISGPHGMVTAFQKTLKGMGVPASRIKTDFFPGFA